jgi:hypothetical protein
MALAWQKCIFNFTRVHPVNFNQPTANAHINEQNLILSDADRHSSLYPGATDAGFGPKSTASTSPPLSVHSFPSSASSTAPSRKPSGISFCRIYKQLGLALAPFPNDLPMILMNIPGPNNSVVSVDIQCPRACH